MTGSEDDPFQRRDTRPFLGKTDRRVSQRMPLQVRLHVDGEAAAREVEGTLSLSAVFVAEEPLGGDDLHGKRATFSFDLDDGEGTIEVTAVVKSPVGRGGAILSLDEADFEATRRVARALDTGLA